MSLSDNEDLKKAKEELESQDNKFWDIWTAHVTDEDARKMLKSEVPYTYAQHKYGCGTMFYIPEDSCCEAIMEALEDAGMSEYFIRIILLARESKVGFVYFDSGGSLIQNLPRP